MNLLNIPYDSNSRIKLNDPTFLDVDLQYPTMTIHVMMPEKPDKGTLLSSFYIFCYSQVILFLNDLDKRLNVIRNYQDICNEISRTFNEIDEDQRFLTNQLELSETGKGILNTDEKNAITIAITFLRLICQELTFRYPNYCQIPLTETTQTINRSNVKTTIEPLPNRTMNIDPITGSQVIDNLFSNIEQTIEGNLQPWIANNRSKDYDNYEINTNFTKRTYRLLYKIEFEKWFDPKTKYYHDLLVNDCIRVRGEAIYLIEQMQTKPDQLYMINYTISQKIIYFIKTISQLLNGYSPSLSDPNAKANLYIINLVRVCLFSAYIEIQEHFTQFIPQTDKVTLRSLYKKYNAGAVPQNTFIRRTKTKPKPKSFEYNGGATALKLFFDSLKNYVKMIDPDTDYEVFKSILSGKTVSGKITIKGASNRLYYLVKELKSHKRIQCPKDHHWYLASICFTYEDGPVDREDIKHMHNPCKEEMKKIEAAISNL